MPLDRVLGPLSIRWPDRDVGPWTVRFWWADEPGLPARVVGFDVHAWEGDSKDLASVLGSDTPGLSASLLRQLPFAELADVSLALSDEIHAKGLGNLPDFVRPAKGRSPLGQDELQQVADVYRNGGSTPTKAVATFFHLSRSAAAKRVTLARAAGLLEPTTQGRIRRSAPSKGTK